LENEIEQMKFTLLPIVNVIAGKPAKLHESTLEDPMQYTSDNFIGAAKIFAAIFVVGTAGMATMSAAARADEVQARILFKAMSDYLAAQKAISLEYDSYLEVITTQEQTIGLASSGTLTLNRPDKIRATRTGGFANVELVFDGKTTTFLGKNANLYAQVETPGTIDQLVDELRDKYHRPLPAADLVMSNAYDQLMPLVKNAKDLGSGVIRGVECDHLAFRMEEADIQIWIARGASPYPCRYTITSTNVKGRPQYTIDIRTWKVGAESAPDSFKAEIPVGAKKLVPVELVDFDELPDIFAPEGAK
jgi:hypothetical protein